MGLVEQRIYYLVSLENIASDTWALYGLLALKLCSGRRAQECRPLPAEVSRLKIVTLCRQTKLSDARVLLPIPSVTHVLVARVQKKLLGLEIYTFYLQLAL